MKLFISAADYSYAAWLKLNSYFHRSKKIELRKNLPTVILVPGVYENWFYFRKIQNFLMQLGYNVVNADNIYRGKSLANDTDSLTSYIKDNSLKGVTLIGHSSGGITALKCLSSSDSIKNIITIATPFSGVMNGHLLRTSLVRELLPNSDEIVNIQALPDDLRKRVVSIYPAYDNQVWSKSGSLLNGARNIQLKKSSGHHLVLKSEELLSEILGVLGN